MPYPAVTEETPAVSESQSNFLPTDEKYRLMGEMPSASTPDPRQIREENRRKSAKIKEKPQEPEVPPVKEGESAAPGESETAAGSEPAKPQKKTPASSESRWQKITRENRELREKLARQTSIRQTEQPQRESERVSPPATEPKPKTVAKPKIDDVDPKTNQPKYKSYADYEEARDQWLLEEGARRAQESLVAAQREQQQSQADRQIQQVVNERIAQVRKSFPDYDEVVNSAIAEKDEHGQDVLFFAAKSPIDGFILNSPKGHEVLYHVAKNIGDPAIREIFARDARQNYLLNPIEQVSRLAVIAHTLGASSGASVSSSAKPVTQASRPPHQLSGTGAVSKDTVAQAIEDGDTETYMRVENARQLARLKGK
jgi:hypothetical protein